MKTPVIAALIVVCCLCHHSAGSIATGLIWKSGCCDSHDDPRKVVPLGCITYMGTTPNDCPLHSVIIKTVRNKQICVDPEEQWVKDALLKFQKFTANNKPPSGPFNTLKCRMRH